MNERKRLSPEERRRAIRQVLMSREVADQAAGCSHVPRRYPMDANAAHIYALAIEEMLDVLTSTGSEVDR